MEVAALGISVEGRDLVVTSDRLTKFGQDASRAEQAAARLSNAFSRFAPIVAAVTAALSVRALKAYADSWSDMQSRVGAAVKNMEAAPALMERLVEVANASYSPLAQTVEIYGRNVAVLRDLGRGATEAADFTEALNHALVLTATRGDRAASVQNALSKAMAVGKLQADGLETVLANGGEVAQVLADKLGTTQSGLRGMASQGKITGDVIASALIGRLEDLRERAGEMPATVEDAMVRLDTNFGALVGRIDQATGISESFASNLIWVADTMRGWTDDIVRAALVIQTGLGAAMEWASNVAATLGGNFDSASALIIAGAGAAGIAVTALTAAITGGLIKAVAALSLALLANPFALLIGGAAAAVTASYLFRDEIAEIIGVDLFKVFYDGANTIIGQMKGAFDAVVVVWDHLPAQFSRIGKLAWNALMDELAGSVKMNNWLTGYEDVDLSFFRTFKHELDEAESYVEGVARAAYNAAQGVDYLQSAGEGIAGMWRDAGDAMTKFGEIANDAGKAAPIFDPKAAKEAAKAAKAYKQIVDSAQEFIAAQRLEAEVLGMTEQAANALRYEQDLLNEARRAGIKLTPEDIHGFKALAEAMAEAEERTRVLTERFEFMKDLTKGFFTDFKNDLISNMSQGMSFWESAWRAMANAALRALDKIVDKLLNDVLDAILRVNSAGSSGGGGGLFGFLGGLFGGFSPTSSLWRPNTTAGAFFTSGFSGGGYTGPGAASNPAGIVHAGEYVFSKQATDRLGVGYLDSLHNAAKGYMAGGLVSRMYAPANANLRGYQSGGLVRPSYESRSVNITIENHGTSKDFEVQQIGPDEVRIIARDEAAKVVQANNKLRQKRYQAGGQFG